MTTHGMPSAGSARRGVWWAGALLALALRAPPAAAEPVSAGSPPATGASAGAAAPAASAPAPGYEFQSGAVCPFCQLTPQFPLGRSGLHWHDHWRAAGTREYVTLGVLVGALAGAWLLPSPSQPSWESPILFDGAVRDALRVRSARGRHVASTISDVLFIWEVAHPTLIDPLFVAWWQRESPFVAWQMFVIDAQAYALTFFVTELTKKLTARERPWVDTANCEQDPSGYECGSGGSYLSFNSGHAATTATGAGLLCAHHTQLSLYQNDVLDVGTCALAVAGTAVTGAMRIASDHHWASDVLVGHLIGYASGYLLPTLLYYRQFRSQPEGPHPPAPTFAALPLLTGEGLGLTVFGQF